MTDSNFISRKSDLKARQPDNARPEQSWRSMLLRGGRVTKYKGVAGGLSPLSSGLGSAVLAAGSVSSLAFGGLLLSTPATFAGACTALPASVCSGAADPANDTMQTFTGSDISITTDSGFGLDVPGGYNGVEIIASGTGDVKFIDENNSSIRADGRALELNTFNLTGSVDVKSTGELISQGIYGLYLIAGQNVTSSTLDLNRVESENYVGMWVENGGGALSITSSDAIIGGSVSGLYNGLAVDSYASATGGINVDVNDVSGSASGIVINANGSGEVSVKSSGTVTGTAFDGIYVAAGSNSDGLTIDANDIKAGRYGINFTHNGTGDTSITANDIVSDGTGIVVNTGFDTEDFTIDVNSIETGAGINVDGIQGVVRGTGDANITYMIPSLPLTMACSLSFSMPMPARLTSPSTT
jgi:hypothetical protein